MTESVDKLEVERFGSIAEEWWSPNGKFRPLHRINPLRLTYIRQQLLMHFELDPKAIKPLTGLRILDVGCGGGLVTEPLTRLGATTTGLDPAEENITAAKAHTQSQDLEIEYISGLTFDLVETERHFDCIVALEVVEHVPDITAFIKSCAELLSPNGLLILSTLNRTATSYAFGIVAAEYVLGWLPKGTHRWDRFIKPEELQNYLNKSGIKSISTQGMSYDLLNSEWHLSEDDSINYFMTGTQKEA